MSIMICLNSVSCRSSWFRPLLLWCLHLFIMITNHFTLLFSFKLLEKCNISCYILVPLRATSLDPLTRTTVYGIGEKLVENLFVFFCLTSTVVSNANVTWACSTSYIRVCFTSFLLLSIIMSWFVMFIYHLAVSR